MTDTVEWRFRRGGWPWFFVFAGALMLASNHVIGRYYHAELPAAGLAFWRIAVAALVLAPFVAREVRREWRAMLAHWSLFGTLALGVVPFGTAAVYLAYQHTTAINGSVVATGQPMMTALLAVLLFRDRLAPVVALGMAVSFAGVMVAIARGDVALLLAFRPNPGDLIMLAAMAGFAVHNVYLRRVPRRFSQPLILFTVQLYGIVVMLPLAISEAVWVRPMPVTWEAAGVVLWVAIGVGIVAVGFVNTAVLALGPMVASASNYLRAAFAAALAILLLGETPAAYHAVAFVLIAGGVWLMSRGRRAPPGNAPARPA